MSKIEFQYTNGKVFIQAIEEDKMRLICSKFTQKSHLDINDLNFIYSGNIVNLELYFRQLINKTDKERKMMSIIVIEHESDKEGKNMIRYPFN